MLACAPASLKAQLRVPPEGDSLLPTRRLALPGAVDKTKSQNPAAPGCPAPIRALQKARPRLWRIPQCAPGAASADHEFGRKAATHSAPKRTLLPWEQIRAIRKCPPGPKSPALNVTLSNNTLGSLFSAPALRPHPRLLLIA